MTLPRPSAAKLDFVTHAQTLIAATGSADYIKLHKPWWTVEGPFESVPLNTQ